MRVIVFSDSHDNFSVLNSIVEQHPDAQAFLHLGDGMRELEDLRDLYPDKLFHGVRGNCDWHARTQTDGLLQVGGVRVFFTHGHMYNVKVSLARLHEQARAVRARVACFGHTHAPLRELRGGLYLFNPGSVSFPRGDAASYGVIDIDGDALSLEVVYL